MKRVACLYRVSTKRQLDDNEIPMQKNACHAFVAQHPDWQIVTEKTERGVSGFKVAPVERDAIMDLRQEAGEGSFDILLVFMLDRLGRMAEESSAVVTWFAKKGIEVWSVKEGRQSLESHADKLMNYISFWKAEGESVDTSIRTRTKLGQMVQEGRFRGGVPAYGYRLEKQGRKNKFGDEVNEIMVDETQAAVVRKIFELSFQRGWGGRKIATALREEGIYNREGKPFHYASIQNILKNVAYTGVLRSGDSVSEVFPALQIIPPAQFERVQKQFASRRAAYEESRQAPLRQEGRNLLSGNVFCGSCGGRIFGSTARRSHHTTACVNGRVPIYKCYNRSQHKGQCEGQTAYTAQRIDEVVDAAVKWVLERAKLTSGRDYLETRKRQELTAIQAQVKRLEKEYQAHEEERRKLSGYIIQALEGKGPFTPEALNERMTQLKAENEALAQQLAQQKTLLVQAERNQELFASQIKELKRYADLYADADISTKRVIVSAIIEKAVISRGYKLDLTFRVGLDALKEIGDAQEAG